MIEPAPPIASVWQPDDRGLPVLVWAGPQSATATLPEPVRRLWIQRARWREDRAGADGRIVCLVVDAPSAP